MKVRGVVLAAGPALLTPLGRRPMLAWAVEALRAGAGLDEVVVAPWGARIDVAALRQALARSMPGSAVPVLAVAPTRHAAVHDALSTLDSHIEIVLLHEVDRPLVPVAVVSHVVSAVRDGAPAAVAVVEVTETVKELAADGRVIRTVPREALVRLQAPYAVLRTLLDAAHARCSPADLTADPIGPTVPPGTQVTTVPGDQHAFPVTTPADLDLAEAVLASMDVTAELPLRGGG